MVHPQSPRKTCCASWRVGRFKSLHSGFSPQHPPLEKGIQGALAYRDGARGLRGRVLAASRVCGPQGDHLCRRSPPAHHPRCPASPPLQPLPPAQLCCPHPCANRRAATCPGAATSPLRPQHCACETWRFSSCTCTSPGAREGRKQATHFLAFDPASNYRSSLPVLPGPLSTCPEPGSSFPFPSAQVL